MYYNFGGFLLVTIGGQAPKHTHNDTREDEPPMAPSPLALESEASY